MSDQRDTRENLPGAGEQPDPARRMAAVGIAGAELAELLALSLIDRKLLDRDDICGLLEGLAQSHRDSGEGQISTALIRLAISLRAARGTLA